MKIDDKVASVIVDNVPFFKYIHPNVITIISLLLNFVILSLLYNRRNNLIFGSVLTLRWLTDLLDGAVARKYKKTSVIGGFLDTLGDLIYILIFAYYFVDVLKLPMAFFYVFLGTVICFIISQNCYHDHDGLKDYNGGIIQKITAFFVNNTYLMYIALFLFANICG